MTPTNSDQTKRSHSASRRSDTQILCELESLPYALTIKYEHGKSRGTGTPSLREQLDAFLDREASAANEKVS